MEIKEKIQALLDNPPCPIEWQSIVGEIIREKGTPSKVSLLCSCGTVKTILANNVLTLHTKSCGCLQKKNPPARKHGQTQTRLYRIWVGIKNRVFNNNERSYVDYGGRGISICDSWKDNFEEFQDWSLRNGYQDTLSIERKDNNGNYCPENCKWATDLEQAKNKRSNRVVTIGEETLHLQEWCRRYKIKHNTVCQRVTYGWTYEEAIVTPIGQKRATIKKTTIAEVTL
jgi:hypothetical protein